MPFLHFAPSKVNINIAFLSTIQRTGICMHLELNLMLINLLNYNNL